jgi:hypothetical protein
MAVRYLTSLAVIGTVFYRIPPQQATHTIFHAAKYIQHFKIKTNIEVVMYSFQVYGRMTCIFV